MDSKEWFISANSIFNGNTIMFEYLKETNGKPPFEHLKAYMNQRLCFLACATRQQHFNQLWTESSKMKQCLDGYG
jgi:hypothetical protein